DPIDLRTAGVRGVPLTVAPTPNPVGSSAAGSLDRGKGEPTPPVGFHISFVPCRRGRGLRRRGAWRAAMTVQRDLKHPNRARQEKAGEACTTARVQPRVRALAGGCPRPLRDRDARRRAVASGWIRRTGRVVGSDVDACLEGQADRTRRRPDYTRPTCR